MKIKKDNINHIFRNKYLVGSNSNVISPISSFNNNDSINKWFYEDENGDLHSKLTLISDKDILAEGGITQFAQGDRTSSTIMDGVVTDNVTITKEDGILKVIGGGSGGGDFDISKMWTALSVSSNEQINKSHLTDALSGYATNNTTFWGQSIKNNTVSGEILKAGGNINLERNNEINTYGTALHINYRGNETTPTGTVTICANGGKVGIGTNSPNDLLDVNGKITGKSLTIKGSEGNHITTSWRQSGSIKNIGGSLTSIMNSLDFNWYGRQWYIGNVRSDSMDSLGFGVAKDDKCYFKVNTDSVNSYVPLRVKGNITSEGTFITTTDTILKRVGYTNELILNRGWDGTNGDYLKFNIPGNNDQSVNMTLSTHNGLKVTSKIESLEYYVNRSSSTYFGVFNSYNNAITGSDPDHKWTWYHAKGGDVQRGLTLWSYAYTGAANQVASFVSYGGNQFKMFGNILATGGITQYSDIRAKNIIEDVNIDLQQIANSPAIRYTWNNLSKCSDSEIHVGGIAQYVKEILPEVIYCTNNDTDLLSMDYATTSYIYSVNIAKHLVAAKNEINELKEQINLLKNTINNNLSTNTK